jgi:hypothetical protein
VINAPKLGDGQRFFLWEDFLCVGKGADEGSAKWLIAFGIGLLPLVLFGLMMFIGNAPSIPVWGFGALWFVCVFGYYRWRNKGVKEVAVKGLDDDEGPIPDPTAYLKAGNEVYTVWDDQLPIAPYPLPVDENGDPIWLYEQAVEAKRFIEQKKVTGFAVWVTKILNGQGSHDISWVYPWVMLGLFLLILTLGGIGLVRSW